MFRFAYLDKQQKDIWLPKMFDLLYDNMRLIAPGDLPYEEEKQQWLSNVSPALKKAPRQVLLAFWKEELVGFIQFYTRQELLMVEEMQIQKEYQGTSLFYALCRFLGRNLPADIHYLEAFAHSQNLHSLKLMQKMGMNPIEDRHQQDFIHLQGQLQSTIFAPIIHIS